jgi:hypothetical protein
MASNGAEFDFSDFTLPPGASTPVKPAAAPPALPPESGLDLLSELRRAAQEKAAEKTSDELGRQGRVHTADRAMRKLFKYFSEFARHLDEIRAPVPRVHRPLPGIVLESLCWSDSFVDYRTNGGTEISPYDTVSLRYTLSAGDTIVIEKLPNHAPAFLEEVKRVGLKHTVVEVRGAKGMVETVQFNIPREVSVSLLFKADPEREVIHLRTRHFVELGSETYTMPVDVVEQAWLDELGKQILGRPSRIFERLVRF